MAFSPCSEHNPAYGRDPKPKGERCATCARIAIEGKVAARFVSEALRRGYYVSVFDCEAFTLRFSRSKPDILAAMFTTDDDRLFVYSDANKESRVGTAWFVYGNDGWDVIADWSWPELREAEMDALMAPVTKYAETLERRHG
jgi:hypothetical protein